MTVSFTVPGEPRGKQRPRTVRSASGKVTTYTPEQTRQYEQLVQLCYREQCRGAALSGAVRAQITGYFPIPKSASRSKRKLMVDGTEPYTKKIDCDNLAKAILDALNGVAYHDDAQVTQLLVKKLYSDYPRVEITLEEI